MGYPKPHEIADQQKKIPRARIIGFNRLKFKHKRRRGRRKQFTNIEDDTVNMIDE